MKKKITAVALVICLLAVAVVGGTLAYFTDTDDATNTFTVGNVDIRLIESTLHRENDKASDAQIEADAENYDDYLEEEGEDMVPGRWVKKAPYVVNDGVSPAYVRVKMTLPKALDDVLYITEYTTGTEQGDFDSVIIPGQPVYNEADGTVTYTWTYETPLQPGAMTYRCPFWRFQIVPELDNDDLADFSGDDVVNSIVVTAEAIQSEGFGSAAEAFAAFEAQTAPAP